MEKDDIIAAKVNETKESKDSQVANPSQKSLWLMIFILLACIAGLTWFTQQQHAKTTVLKKHIDQIKQNDDLTQLKTMHITDLSALSKSVAGLTKKIDDLTESQQFTNDDVVQLWVLAEVEFLLRAANQSVLLTGNIEDAIASLVMADKRLATLDNPRLYALRSLISNERLSLAATDTIDIAGMAAQLGSMIGAVDSLKLPTDFKYSAIAETDNNTLQAKPHSNWETLLLDIWKQLKSLVIIRQKRQKDAVFLLPDQRYFLYQNLRLKLETARMALLSDKESVFYNSMASTDKWLQQYFIGKERDAMLATINELRSENIKQPQPDISASLRWLERYRQK